MFVTITRPRKNLIKWKKKNVTGNTIIRYRRKLRAMIDSVEQRAKAVLCYTANYTTIFLTLYSYCNRQFLKSLNLFFLLILYLLRSFKTRGATYEHY